MFSKRNVESVKVLMKALDEFSNVSGLKPSMEKSTVYMSNIPGDNREDIMNIRPFRTGNLPVRYLGVPHLSKGLHPKDCKGIIDRVQKRLMDWKNFHLLADFN